MYVCLKNEQYQTFTAKENYLQHFFVSSTSIVKNKTIMLKYQGTCIVILKFSMALKYWVSQNSLNISKTASAK